MALHRISLAHPGDFTHKVVFRRCPACGQPNIVRDGDFASAVNWGYRRVTLVCLPFMVL